MHRNLTLIVATDTEELVPILTTVLRISYSFFPTKIIVLIKLRITLFVLKQH
jgi:hypothetical protein